MGISIILCHIGWITCGYKKLKCSNCHCSLSHKMIEYLTPILEHNFVGSDYDLVNILIHGLVHIPIDIDWHRMNPHPFRGTIPKGCLGKDEQVFQAIHSTHPGSDIDTIRQVHKNFRSEYFFRDMFKTTKPLHGYQYKHLVVFNTSGYNQDTHQANLNLFKLLAKAFQHGDNITEIYSIKKDRHEYTRAVDRPFARDHIALLVVRRLVY